MQHLPDAAGGGSDNLHLAQPPLQPGFHPRQGDTGGTTSIAAVGPAKEGDTGAAGLVLSRILPALRSQSEKVAFEFDPSLPISRQVEQVLQAISEGAVAPDTGKLIIDAIQSLNSIRATEELEQRIILLEARQVN